VVGCGLQVVGKPNTGKECLCHLFVEEGYGRIDAHGAAGGDQAA